MGGTFIIDEIMLTGLCIMCDHRVFGIGSKFIDGDESRFIVYNPRTKEVDAILGPVTNGFWSSDELDEIPRALSDKGGLFTCDFRKIKDGTPHGFKIKEFDSSTYRRRCVIEISQFIEDEWFDEYRVADAVRVNEECVLIACYVNDKYKCSGLEIFSYYQKDDEMYSINRYDAGEEDEMVFYDVSFSRDGTKLTCKRTDEDMVLFYPETPIDWENVEITFDANWQSSECMITGNPEEEHGLFSVSNEDTLDIDSKGGSIIRTGYFKVSNVYGGEVLIDEAIGKDDFFYYFTVEPLDLFFAEIEKKGETDIYMLGRYRKKWQLGGCWTVPGIDSCKFKYDKRAKTVIIETADNSILISKRAL